MGANETIAPSKSDKSSSVIFDQSSVRSYPDWGTLQAYYGPGVPFPTAYFGTTVAPPGHAPYPYMWTPQLPHPILTPFGGAYPAIYPHGGLYSHPSATHIIPDPVNPEAPAKSSNTAKKMKRNDATALASTGNLDASANCSENRSDSEENEAEEGSSDGSDGNSESGGSEKQRNRSSEDMPCSGSKNLERTNNVNGATATNILPNTSLGMTIPLINLTPGMDLLRSSSVGKQKPTVGEPISASMDERAFKREKRKQSNRESARRSRLRKQAETEELAIRVGSMSAENTTLRSEITRLIECSDKLRIENSILTKKLKTVQVRQKNVEISTDGMHGEGPLVIENLLSRMDKSIPAVPASCEAEDDDEEVLQNSGGKLHQLLDANPRTTDIVAANS